MRYAIFCQDPLNPRSVDPAFSAELLAAEEAGFVPLLLDHDALDHRINASVALKRTHINEPGLAVFRGWMLRSEAYTALNEALHGRGVELLTNPSAYETLHHAPLSYPFLSAFMPKTTWIAIDRLETPDAVASALGQFGGAPVVIKDWVKSQASGYWSEACYIPDASDLNHAGKVIARFQELQGESLVGGIVFKAYVPLVPRGKPADEYRAFVVGGRIVGCWPRSPGATKLPAPPAELLTQIASAVPSPFASMDFGIDEHGKWWLLESGDGQVSGLPHGDLARQLFQALSALH